MSELGPIGTPVMRTRSPSAVYRVVSRQLAAARRPASADVAYGVKRDRVEPTVGPATSVMHPKATDIVLGPRVATGSQ